MLCHCVSESILISMEGSDRVPGSGPPKTDMATHCRHIPFSWSNKPMQILKAFTLYEKEHRNIMEDYADCS